MNTPMAAATKATVGPRPGLLGARDKRTAVATGMTTPNQNDQSTMVAVEGAILQNTITLVAAGGVGRVQRITIKLAAMICGDRTVLGSKLLG